MWTRCQKNQLKASHAILGKYFLCLIPFTPIDPQLNGRFVSSFADNAGYKVMEHSPATHSRMPLNQEASVFCQRDRLKNASGTSMSRLLSNTLASRE